MAIMHDEEDDDAKKALMYDYDDQVDGDGVCNELVVRYFLRLLIMRGAACAIRVLRFSILCVVDDVDDAGDDDHVGVDVVITVDEGAPDAT